MSNSVRTRAATLGVSLLALLWLPATASGQRLELLHSFTGCGPACEVNDGAHPRSALVRGADGALFGTTTDFPTGGLGTIFRIDSTGALTTLMNFSAPTTPPATVTGPFGCFPGWNGPLTFGSDGALYGATDGCGLFNGGTLFRVTPGGSFTTLHDFVPNDPARGWGPQGGIVQRGPGGAFYGASLGGVSGFGRVYRVDVNGVDTTVYSFSGTEGGAPPSGNLTLASDGNVYGTARIDFGGYGLIYRITPADTFEVVHVLDGSVGNGPGGALVQGVDGALYGTASAGNGCGTIFRVTLAGDTSLVHDFNPNFPVEGCLPQGPLVQTADGTIYGVTTSGGAANKGTVFRLGVAGDLIVLHDFQGPEGARPFGGLVLGADGHLYGTTYEGGSANLGVVFRVALPRAESDTLQAVEDIEARGTLLATDPNGLPLTFSIVSNGLIGTATITDAGTGAYTYAPVADANGSDSFTFLASNGTMTTDVGIVTVAIAAVNDAPVAANGVASTSTGSAVGGVLSASDVDSAVLTFAIVNAGTKGTAVVTNSATGAYTYTPNAGTSGTDAFTFRANDGSLDSNIATITVTIANSNLPPVANDARVATLEDSTVSGSVTATDPEGAPLTYAVVANGTKGHATFKNSAKRQFTYVPNADATGTDTFTYRVNDGQLNSSPASVTVTITPVDDAPLARDAKYVVRIGSILDATLVATDVDSTTLVYSIQRPNNLRGTLTLLDAATGAFRFVPDLGVATGTFSFTFTATDSAGKADTGKVTITINRCGC